MRKTRKNKLVKNNISRELKHELERPKRPHFNPDRNAIHMRGSSADKQWWYIPEVETTNKFKLFIKRIKKGVLELWKLIK